MLHQPDRFQTILTEKHQITTAEKWCDSLMFSCLLFCLQIPAFYPYTGSSPALQTWPRNSSNTGVKVHRARQINAVLSWLGLFKFHMIAIKKCCKKLVKLIYIFIKCVIQIFRGVSVTELAFLKQNKHLESMDCCIYITFTISVGVKYLKFAQFVHISVTASVITA